MDRGVGGICQLLIGCRRQKHVRSFHADLELVEIVVLQDADMIQPAFHHRFRARLAVLFQQVLFQRPGIDPDADRTTVILGCLDHLTHARGIADVARIDPQAGGASLGGFDGALVVEMDVGHDGHGAFGDDRLQRLRRVPVGRGNPDDVGTRNRTALHLFDCGGHIRGQRVGHRLDRNRRVTAHGHFPHPDLTRLAPVNVAPGANGIVRHGLPFRVRGHAPR